MLHTSLAATAKSLGFVPAGLVLGKAGEEEKSD